MRVEHLLPQLDRDRRLLQLLRGQLGDLDELRAALGRVGDALDLLLVNADQLLPVAPLLVVHLEVRDRGGVATVELEHLLVGLDGLGDVRELLLEQAGDAQVELDLLVRIVSASAPSSAGRR